MALDSRIFLLFFMFLCFLVLGVRATEQNVVSFKDTNGNTVNVKYESVGCFHDKRSRALREMYFNARNHINWQIKTDFTNIIRTCIENAYNRGYRNVIGIQYYGECWSDPLAEYRYSTYGSSSNCENGVGKEWTNMVYRFSAVTPKLPAQSCNINGKEYSEGAQMFIPNDWTSNVFNAKCMKCICAGGQAVDCQLFMYCDTGFQHLCSKWRNATGQCCPVCDCYNDDGEAMEVGSNWTVRVESKCAECLCSAKKEAICGPNIYCPPCSGEAIPEPGKCCPKCVAKTTTSKPPETIPLQTERPPPTWPPFPMP